jgi:hypothetical protein
MSRRSTPTTIARMSIYAVFWRNNGVAFHGRLEFDPHGLWLDGGEPGYELRVEVPYDEIVGVEHDSQTKIGPCQAIRVKTRAAGSLLIASAGGLGILGEIQDALMHATQQLS